MKKKYDLAIIGGGIYGSLLALHLQKKYANIILIERENQLISKASYFNQARVHNGYHYPRSFITAIRSHQNFVRFCKQFKPAIVSKYPSLYAIARQNSKVTSLQFAKFCQMIGTPIQNVSNDLKKLFNSDLIEEVFQVEEFEFDAAILRKTLSKKIQKSSINLSLNSEVEKVYSQSNNQIGVILSSGTTIFASKVINCTYAGINTILKKSEMPLIPLKLEYTEMPLIKLPATLNKFGITIMDGPFFSLLPFPDRKMHSFHHVRYTPHISWYGTDEDIDKEALQSSHFQLMLKDAQRYIPQLKNLHSDDSLFQTKAVLKMTENNDGRPIYFHKNYQIPNFHLVMGGKIDNVYDIIEEINSQGL
jgi:glycine/D-amino acid oxidase-like deaminating enzyme